jgi:hypothetical protein
MGWGFVKQTFNSKRIHRILADLSFEPPNYITGPAKMNETLARELITFVKAQKKAPIPDYKYLEFATDLFNQGILNDDKYSKIFSTVLNRLYKELYFSVCKIDLKELKKDCSFENVSRLTNNTFSVGISYLLSKNIIDADENKKQICNLFTFGKSVNYLASIKSELNGSCSKEKLLRFTLEITDESIFRRSLIVIKEQSQPLLIRILKEIIRDLGDIQSKNNRIHAIKQLSSYPESEGFFAELLSDPVYSYLTHWIIDNLPMIYSSLNKVTGPSMSKKVSVLGAFRQLPLTERMNHYRRVLNDYYEDENFKKTVIKELGSIDSFIAGKLLFEKLQSTSYDKHINQTFQIWSIKHAFEASQLFKILKGRHKKADMIRVIAANELLGSVKTLLMILIRSNINESDDITNSLKPLVKKQSETDLITIQQFVNSLLSTSTSAGFPPDALRLLNEVITPQKGLKS